MKKLSLLLLLMLSVNLYSTAQQWYMHLTVVQSSCSGNNNIVSVDTIPQIGTQLAFPITINYILSQPGGQPQTFSHTNVMTLPDVLPGLGNGQIQAYGTDNNGNPIYVSDSTILGGLNLQTASTMGNCPTLGSASVTVGNGGVAPYSYTWTNANGSVVSNNATFSGYAGQYQVKVTDNAGCVDSTNAYIEDQFHINANITTVNANCTNGSATIVSATGGTAPYTYLWANGATGSSINNLVQGYYSVVITDANGCPSTSYAYVQQAVNIGVNPVATPATCLQYNGSATTFGSGGTPPYTYQYSTGFTGQTLTGVQAGYYQVTVTDANGCFGNGGVYISASTPITATNAVTPSACTSATGGAVLAIAGGQPGYTVHWDTYPGQTSANLTGVFSGTYGFHITDANGCVQNGSVYVPPVNVLTGSISATSTYCTSSTGTATIAGIGGGAAPYTYTWNTGATGTALTGLAAGSYNVTVTDNIGCHKNFYTYVPTYSPVQLGASSTPASCIFNADGAIVFNATNGTAPYTYSPIGAGTVTGNTVTNLPTGGYYSQVTDFNGCTATVYSVVDYDHNNNSCYCTITGQVYDDANGNCVQDAGENGIEHIGINCSGIGIAYTDATGQYAFKVPTGSYTLSENVQAYYPLAACQNNSVAVNTVASSGCTQTVDFANVINPIHDMSITTFDWTGAIPGFPYQQKTIVSNDGTVTETTAVAGYNTDGQLNGATMSPYGFYTASGNQYNAAGITLSPGQQQVIDNYYNVPTNIPLNTAVIFKDSVAYTSPMSNWLNDYSPWNNVNYYTATTIGAYDPNSIQVSPQGAGTTGNIHSQDSILTYMVHFQNTGTYYAQNVVVKTKLDANLDWKTLRPQYSSAPASVTIDPNGIATYTFSNIHLPWEAMSADGSQGMFTFTIHLRHGLPAGTTFSNKADIYFDFNAPVTTNSTLNTLLDPTAIGNTTLNKATFTVFPNPTSGNFTANITATGTGNAELKVMDISGRTLKSQSVTLTGGTQAVPVTMGSLASGIYFVTLTQNGVTTTQKLTVGK